MSSEESAAIRRIARGSIGLRAGTFFLFPAAILIATGLPEWRAGERQRRDAGVATATVTAKSIDPARIEGNPRTRYLITVAFDAGGVPVEREEEVPVEEWEALGTGSPRAVRYLAAAPADAAAAARIAGREHLAGLAAGLGALGFAVLIALPALRRIRRVRRLIRTGERTQGTVIEAFPTGTVIDRVRQWRVRYEFRDAHGVSVRGESDLLSPAEARARGPGASIEVVFDADDLRRSHWLDPAPGTAPSGLRAALLAAAGRALALARAALIGILLAAACAAVALVPPVARAIAVIEAHSRPALAGAIAAVSAGLLAFLAGIVLLLIERGRPLGRVGVEDQARRVRLLRSPAAWRAGSYRLRGPSGGAAGEDSFTLGELKAAWRTGLVRRDPGWRRRLLVVSGALLMSFGILALLGAVGPPWVKVLAVALALTIILRLGAALRRA